MTHEMTSQNSVMRSRNGCRNHGVSQLCGHKIITMMTHEMTSQNSVMGSRKGCRNHGVSSVTSQTAVVETNYTVYISIRMTHIMACQNSVMDWTKVVINGMVYVVVS